MSKQTLIDELVKINKRILTTINAYPMTEHNLAVRAELVNVHILIDDLISHYNKGWINADTPPDDNHYVWVSYKPIRKSYPNNIDRPRRYCMGFYNLETKRWIVSDADRLLNYVCEVTHWQKIIPPKEKDE